MSIKDTPSHRDIIDKLKRDMDSARRFHASLSEQRARWYATYRGLGYENRGQGWSSSVAAVVWQAVEWMRPGLVNIFTSDFYRLKSRQPGLGEAMSDYLDYKLYRQQDGAAVVEDLIHDALVGHFGVAKVHYVDEYRDETETRDLVSEEEFAALARAPELTIARYDVVERLDERTGQGLRHYEKVKLVRRKTQYQGPRIECVPPSELYFLPGYAKLTDCPFVAHRVKRTLDDIARLERAGVYRLGSRAEVEAKVGSRREDPDTAAEQAVYDAASGLPSADHLDGGPLYREADEIGANEVYVWECYKKIDLDGDGLLEDAIVTVCEDVVLSEPVENPYGGPPFELVHAHKEPHRLTGFGLASILEDEQKAMTNLMRLVQDIPGQFAYPTVTTTDPATQRALAQRSVGEVLLVRGDYRVFEPGSNMGDVLRALEYMRAETENKSGITRYTQGLDASSLNKTATGVQAVMSASQQRMQLVAKRMSRAFQNILRRVLRILELWPPTDDLPLLGRDIELSPRDFAAEMEIDIDVGVGPMDKQRNAAELDRLVQFLVAVGIPMGLSTPMHLREAVTAKGKLLGVDLEAFLVPKDMLREALIEMTGAQDQLPGQAKPGAAQGGAHA